MRLILITIISILTLSVNGQNKPIGKKSINSFLTTSSGSDNSVIDTIPKVIYLNKNEFGMQPAYFIDGKHINATILRTIDPILVDNINVVKEDIEIQGEKFYGKVYLKMKDGYNPKLISLTDLKLKCTRLADRPAIFRINNNIIKGDYSKCIVDEKYIYQIIVDEIENKEENLHVDIVNLFTKTEENIKKSKEIRIRGFEETALD